MGSRETDGIVYHTINTLKRLSKRMRLKGSKLIQDMRRRKRIAATLISRSDTWEAAAQLLEEEIESLEKQL